MKIKILYVIRGLEQERGFEREMFVIGHNMLKEPIKRPELEVKIYAGTHYYPYLRMKRCFTSQANMGDMPEFSHGDIKDFDILYFHAIKFQMR
jgi:hypothetical protein